MWDVEILLDSIAPCGSRLTTLKATYPRFIHSELMTHRALSRNAASSRAIPIDKIIKMVEENPAIPCQWGQNQKGMQAGGEIADAAAAEKQWKRGAKRAVLQAKRLKKLGLHKQIVNRVLEPYMWMTTIITATEWENFFILRRHKDAQPEFHKLADMIFDAMSKSEPQTRSIHLPFVDSVDMLRFPQEPTSLLRMSAARCARVSYLTQAGFRDHDADLTLAQRLLDGSDGIGHLSPFEHQGWPLHTKIQSGNFVGWEQYRKVIEREMKRN